MERRLKERIIGAVVLVGLAVLILPAILKGPRDATPPAESHGLESTRTETIELQAEAAAHEDEPAHVDAPAEIPAAPTPIETPPAVEQPLANTEPESHTKPAAPPPAAPPAAHSAAVPAASSTASGWAVQVGTFASRSNADALATRLKELGHATFVLPVTANGKTLYRVRVGPVADLESARALQQRLATQHVDGNPVRNP
jgi:DedD protein